MAWYRVDPRYLRQADPDGLTLAYVSHGELDSGHLVLHLDRERDVAGFELAYDRFLSGCELFAEWDRAPSVSDLIDRALVAYARQQGYDKPIPKR